MNLNTVTSIRLLAMALLSLSLLSCEKAIFSEEEENKEQTEKKEGEVRVKITVGGFEQVAFDMPGDAPRRAKAVGEVCSRIDFAMFDGDSSYEFLGQTSDDSDFGTFSLDLPKGTYEAVMIAHNGLGSAKISSPSKVTFKDNKVTDTFFYYGKLKIEDDCSFNLTLKRAVAMFRLVVEDKTPSNVSQMKLYYTGGSSTFDATTGYGCVNSRQTELRDVAASAYTSASQYEVYTFPHSDGKNLKMTVTALNSSEASVAEKTFENVPVTTGVITQYSGTFFSESPGGGRVSAITVDDEWSQDDYEY